MKKVGVEKMGFRNFKKERIFLLILILIFTLSLFFIFSYKGKEAVHVTGSVSQQIGYVKVNVIGNVTSPTCHDGIQNQGETGVDCGGPCSVCSTGGGGGGGGGGAPEERVSMKIIVPSITAISKTGKNKFNIHLENDGEVNFNDISIKGYLLGDSKLLNSPVTFDPDSINLLESGKTQNILATVSIDDLEILIYEVVINVTSRTPAYNVYNEVFITFLGNNITNVQKIIEFTDGIINENDQCAEFKTMLDDAKKELAAGTIEKAGKDAQAAMEACKRAIQGLEQPAPAQSKQDNTVKYVIIATISAGLLGFLFNIYRQIMFKGLKLFFHVKN